MLAVYKADSVKREALDKSARLMGGANFGKVQICLNLMYAGPETRSCRGSTWKKLDVDFLDKGVKFPVACNQGVMRYAWAFWRDLEVTQCNQYLAGVTWLELFFLFVIRGGELCIADVGPKDSIITGIPLRAQLARFKCASRHIFKHCLAEGDKAFVKVQERPLNRFKNLAIEGHNPRLCCWPVLEPDEDEKLGKMLMRLRGPVFRHTISEIKNGSTWSKPIAAKLHVVYNWSREIETTPYLDIIGDREECVDLPHMPTKIACPGCKGKRDFEYTMGAKSMLVHAAYCGSCARAWQVELWECDCGQTFHDCPVHGYKAHIPQPRSQKAKTPQSPLPPHVGFATRCWRRSILARRGTAHSRGVGCNASNKKSKNSKVKNQKNDYNHKVKKQKNAITPQKVIGRACFLA
jgi:hypothetical protein